MATSTTTETLLDTGPFRTILEGERSRIRASLDELAAERRALLSDDGERDEDLDDGGGEGSTLGAELGRIETLWERLDERLLEVEAALGRIEKGTYGVCRSCGGPVGVARLEAMPEVTECVSCKQAPAWVRRPLR